VKLNLKSAVADAFDALFLPQAKAPLALLRLHKTGSQSFRNSFEKYYLRSERCPLEYSTTLTAPDLKNKTFVSPHLSLSQWNALEKDGPWQIAVTMREPRMRLRSAFAYFKGKRGAKPLQVGELLADLDYRGFLLSDHPVLVCLKDNMLTRFLGGGQFGMETETRNQLYLPDGLSIEEAENMAAKALNSDALSPLVLELPVQSIQRLAVKLGIKDTPNLRWVNATKDKAQSEPTPDILALELAFVERDLRLYNFVFSRLTESR
jgi:hypothetical protein